MTAQTHLLPPLCSAWLGIDTPLMIASADMFVSRVNLMSDSPSGTHGGAVPKVKRPKKGWFKPTKKKPRRGPRVKASEKGLPPCPACGQWSMQRDNEKGELYCGACGAIM